MFFKLLLVIATFFVGKSESICDDFNRTLIEDYYDSEVSPLVFKFGVK